MGIVSSPKLSQFVMATRFSRLSPPWPYVKFFPDFINERLTANSNSVCPFGFARIHSLMMNGFFYP